MKKIFFFTFCTMFLAKALSQNYTSVADSLRQNGTTRLVRIQIDEVDSVQFFKKPEKSNMSSLEWRAAFFYQGDGTSETVFEGRIVDVFASLIYKPSAYVKTEGLVPNVFIRCTVGIRPSFRNPVCGISQFLNVVNFMERYYNCRLEKVSDSVDVWVIHKKYPEKLSALRRPEKPESWRDANGRLLYQQYISQLDGDDISALTTYMSYNHKEIFVLDDKDKSDTSTYYIIMESKENMNFDDVYKEMTDNGLYLTKEKRMMEFYRLTFF